MIKYIANKYGDFNMQNILDCEYMEKNCTNNFLELEIYPKETISFNDILTFKSFLKDKEKKEIEINIKYNEEIETSNILEKDWCSIVDYISKTKPMVNTMLKDSYIKPNDSEIDVFLPFKCSNFLLNNSYDNKISKAILKFYSKKYVIKFFEDTENEVYKKVSKNIKSKEEDICKMVSNGYSYKADDTTKITTNEQEDANDKNDIISVDYGGRYIKVDEKARVESEVSANANISFKCGGRGRIIKSVEEIDERRKQNPLYIYGNKNISSQKLTKIVDINLDSERVKIQGEIIDVETTELRDGRALITINIYDGSLSIFAKTISKKDIIERVKGILKGVSDVVIDGTVRKEKYSDDLMLFINSIHEKKNLKENNKDNKNEEKSDGIKEEKKLERVELTAHTCMSMLKGLMSVNDVTSFAEENNMKAIGITDNYVVQAFPDFMNIAAAKDIKAIYGMKGAMVDDNVSPITFSKNQNVYKSTYCLLDIETTGFSFRTDKITEIGVLKYVDGKIVDTFETFVNPEIPIPEHITKLTGITDEMVKDAPKIDEAMKQFIDFVGEDSILVAHNATFDLGFLKYNAEAIGLKLDNTYIDTLVLAKQIYPDLKKYKLRIYS